MTNSSRFATRSGTNEPQGASSLCGLGSSAAADEPYRHFLTAPTPDHLSPLTSYQSPLVAASPRGVLLYLALPKCIGQSRSEFRKSKYKTGLKSSFGNDAQAVQKK